LRGGNSEIEKDAVEFEAGCNVVGARRQRGEGREEHRHPRIGREARARFGDGDGVAVETEQSTVSNELLHNRPSVSTPPISGVQVDAACPYVQCRQYLR